LYKFALKENEQILRKGLAVMLHDRESLSGALYLTNKRLVFVGYMHGCVFVHENEIELSHIRQISGGRSFLIIPNEMTVTTSSGERFRFTLTGRDGWISAISEVTGKN
jgi:hypothetical protein